MIIVSSSERIGRYSPTPKKTPWNFFSTWLPYFCLLQLLEPKNPSQNCVLWGQIFPWTLLSDLSINERIYKQKDRVIAVLAVHLIVQTIAFTTMMFSRFGHLLSYITSDCLNIAQKPKTNTKTKTKTLK